MWYPRSHVAGKFANNNLALKAEERQENERFPVKVKRISRGKSAFSLAVRINFRTQGYEKTTRSWVYLKKLRIEGFVPDP